MPWYKAKVVCYFDIEIEDDDIKTAKETIEMSRIQELIDYECDYNDTVQYVLVKNIEEVKENI